jgi:hypothetical protein
MIRLPRIIEQHIVTKTVLEFDFVADDPNDGMTRLRVTVDAQGITVHDAWDVTAHDFTVGWDDLREWKRATDDLRRYEEDAKADRECAAALLLETRCRVLPLRAAEACQAVRCGTDQIERGRLSAGAQATCE